MRPSGIVGLVIAGFETSAAVFRSLFASTLGLPTEPMRQGPLIGVTDQEGYLLAPLSEPK